MSRKPAKSQWDFGELFPVEATRRVLTVAELTAQVKGLLEGQVGQVWVAGEVSNLRAQSSGHAYFILKDAESQLNCVLFRTERQKNSGLLEDGRRVVLLGNLTVYELRGQYQLRVMAVELQGVGALQAAFEKLKQKLNEEGLFAAERKRPLPRFPRRVGIVTSPTGAALQDVLHVVRRRDPSLEIVLASCRVQGQGAAEEIVAAIGMLNDFGTPRTPGGTGGGIDLILVTRGGGSLEDLWAFNEEVVARAIFESWLPVVSAVGHEIDFTLSDFVADLRAATPSAAAEMLTEGVFSSKEFVATANDRMRQLLRHRMEEGAYEIEQLRGRLVRLHPWRRVNELFQQLDDFQGSLLRFVKQATRERRVLWRNVREKLLRARPALVLEERRGLLNQLVRRLRQESQHQLLKSRNRFLMLEARLRLLGPEQVLARGYSITMRDDTGEVIRDGSKVKAGQRLRTRLKSGVLKSIITENANESR
ncbi:MAG TPA: exodeoxyribonuclease VII large subunit [Verrucomicrobiae bacterium]|jgi:exodeoxyribonuclease VII large subunit|nr:exodeoxyribonuclease VII large subunit [Verrucomicrobiae bacterium]